MSAPSSRPPAIAAAPLAPAPLVVPPGAAPLAAMPLAAMPLATARRHAHVPTECALCGAGEFSTVIEVAAGAARVLHWVSPPPGWYLLREARPEPGAPLLHGRCPSCMEQLFGVRR